MLLLHHAWIIIAAKHLRWAITKVVAFAKEVSGVGEETSTSSTAWRTIPELVEEASAFQATSKHTRGTAVDVERWLRLRMHQLIERRLLIFH